LTGVGFTTSYPTIAVCILQAVWETITVGIGASWIGFIRVSQTILVSIL